MRDQMQPGSGVRTIGGMYATVKEVRDDTILLEVAPSVYAIYAKNAIGAVLDNDEYNRIVTGGDEAAIDDVDGIDGTTVPDDASSLTGTDAAEGTRVDFGKKPADEAEAASDTAEDTAGDSEETAGATDAKAKDSRTEGDTEAK
jgi:preprotein translocase subunit YajC